MLKNIINLEPIEIKGKRLFVAPAFAKDNLNLVFSSKDDNFRRGDNQCTEEEIAQKSRDILEHLNIAEAAIMFTNQVHGIDVEPVLAKPKQGFGRLECGDGLMTTTKDVCLAMTFADCVPIVLVDRTQEIVAAVHSGWRGTVSHIVQVAVGKMIAAGANIENIEVLLGPHIGLTSFEVGDDVKAEFAREWPNVPNVILTRQGKTYIDMEEAIGYDLMSMGLAQDNLYTVNQDTVSNAEIYHSFRRDGADYQLMACFVGLKG